MRRHRRPCGIPAPRAAVLLAAGLASSPWLAARAENPPVACARCHGNTEFLAGKGGTPAGDATLFVPDSILAGTRHAALKCRDCHAGYDEAFPHQPGRSTVACSSCHNEAGTDWASSVHARNAQVEGDAPTCVRCHGSHRILGADDRASPIHPLREARLCAECHADPKIVATWFTDPADSVARTAVERYRETVHGLALERSGLVVSATCSDCHRAHRVLPAGEAGSSIHREGVAGTCGACHEGVLDTYRSGAHGAALRTGATTESGHRAPVCIDCHSAHGVAAVDEAWRVDIVDECATCHARHAETYFATYHGKVTRLGGPLVAKCSACHTAHGNLPADDLRSSVHPSNLVATCAQCHEQASAGFVEYWPHGDPADRERYPVLFWTRIAMWSLLTGVFGFFGTHSAVWLARSLDERARRNREGAGGAGAADAERGVSP
jgi:hypothetical protein